jgi:hypothetical protein
MRLYFKATKAYAGVVFRPDEEEREHGNLLQRYTNYTIDNLMIVDDAHGHYVECPMPKPFSIPGKIYWRVLHIWQTKIAKTHI